jgi:hypothetical protein
MLSTWTIHDKDGGYLGESKAMSAKIAFVIFMSARGRSVNLADVRVEPLPDGRTQVTHRGKVHFFKKKDE